MKQICAWCNAEMGNVDSKNVNEKQVSHGICSSCGEFFMKNQLSRPLSDFLNGLPYPIAVINDDYRVEFANTQACDMLGKEIDEFKGYLGGDAFECAYARLPEGCGKTEHCKACTIRLAIEKTFETGENQENITAALTKALSDGTTIEERLKIFTLKKDNMVYLRIKKV